MKIAFLEKLRLSATNEKKLVTINEIIEEYQAQGYTLTLRQLYYQLVARGIIPNKQTEYAKLSHLLKEGRMAGMVSWSAIEDRLRKPYLPYWANSVSDAIQDITRSYRLNRQEGQDVYIEIWVEKDALSGVLRKITKHYHVNLMVNRGYSSCSAMFEAFRRLQGEEAAGKKTVILYLGDHDPSGLDMIRDIRDRLRTFGVNPDVKHIGITKEQIDELDPPKNPAKITDPRAGWYLAEHGKISWEVDALPPKYLNELLEEEIENLIDMDKFQDMIEKEETDRETLEKLARTVT